MQKGKWRPQPQQDRQSDCRQDGTTILKETQAMDKCRKPKTENRPSSDDG